jgi:hypothetical protein
VLLSLPAFYLVKNTVERDEQTRVGQIIATTPLSKPLYTLGKAFSNFVFLAVTVGVIALAAGGMQLIRAEVLQIDLWALFSPFLFFTLPVMAMLAAVAVLFETISWLRGTLGNVVYFVLWFVLLIVSAANLPSTQEVGEPANDFWGIQILLSDMMKDALTAFPDYQGQVSIGLIALPMQTLHQTFTWEGIHWTSQIIFGRLSWVAAAVGIGLLSALFFRRFDPAPRKPKPVPEDEALAIHALEDVRPAPVLAPVQLTPLRLNQRAFYPLCIFQAELRLLLRGIRWWWLILLVGLNAAGILLPTERARQYLLPVAWILPLALWSGLGTREKRHNTAQLIFSAPYSLSRQFPLVWLAGVAVSVVVGAGVAVNMIVAGDWLHLAAWGIGALFIPSLALALGVWSGSSKLFEVVYMLWWYAGPLNRVESLDFMGTGANLQTSTIGIYGLLTILLLALAAVGRKKQLKR